MKLVVPAEKMKQYRATARLRRHERENLLKQRRDRALQITTEAAEILGQHFGVERVVLFGSLVSPDGFHWRSDLDLAVWGLAERDHYRAVARLLSLDHEFSVDIIRAESANARLLERVEQEGIPL
jgi:predicted nucleotidyltransferase